MKRILSTLTVVFLLISFTPSAHSTSPNLSEIAFQEFETDRYPFSIVTTGAQEFWIASWYKNSVSRFDVKSGSYTDTVSVGVHPVDLTLNNNNLWVLNYDDMSISVIDIKTKVVVNTIILPNIAEKITSGGKYVWVQLSNLAFSPSYLTKSRILKFDGLSAKLLSTWEIGPCSSLPCSTTNFIDGEISAIAANNSSSWFCYRDTGKSSPIKRINSATDSASIGLQTPQNCDGIWANDDYLAVQQDETVYIYDARDYKRLGSVYVSQSDGSIKDLVFTEDSFYLSVYNVFRKNASSYLYDFDLKNMKLKEKIELTDFALYNFVVTSDQVWAIGITQSQDGSTNKSKLVNFKTYKFRVKAAAEKAAAELKAKQEAEAKAAAELKVKQEAETKAAAELKAKQEAEAKAAVELKAKQDAEVAAAKAAAELKAKQDAEAKAAADLKAKQEADTKAAAMKKTTITCVKGKLSKKVTAVKPKCPSGFKLKK